MDFSFSDVQRAVSDAATGLLSGLVDTERVVAAERSEDAVDRALWRALAEADLLGLAVPEEQGGAGYGLTELCLLLQAQGNVVAPVPLWSTLVLGALPLARFGHPEQRGRWLPRVVTGEVMLTAALTSCANSVLEIPSIEATPHVGGWALSGVELAVPQAHLAGCILVPARSPDGGILIALVDPRSPGVELERAFTTNREIHPHLHMRRVDVLFEDVLVGPESGRAALDDMLVAAKIALCAMQVGVCEAALGRTAAYLNQRTQFGRALSTFQATMLRAADAAIDIEAMRVTLLRAAWLFDTGRDAAEAAGVAKWQASERGQRIVHATQHLHGGLGADVTYPIHRYFLWGKQIELMLGGPSLQLSRLGAQIAARAGGHLLVTSMVSDLTFSELAVGDELPSLVVPITRTLIVGGALASRDYQDVHHDPELARARGSKDIFMNILTTNGLVGRFVTDWSGPRSRLSRVNIALGAPNYPGSVMTLTGSVTEKGPVADDMRSGRVTVSVRGVNELGDHVSGTVVVVLPMSLED